MNTEKEDKTGRVTVNRPYTMNALSMATVLEIEQALRLETVLMGPVSLSEDAKEGIQAVMGKRPHNFKGR
jgi:hypothetical protein